MRRRLVIAAALAVVAAVAVAVLAMGSSGTMTGQQVADCFNSHPTGDFTLNTNKADLDYIAQAASDEGMQLEQGAHTIAVVVERDEAGAKATAGMYEGAVRAFHQGAVERHGNVVVAYSEVPTDGERRMIGQCVP